MQGQQMLTGDFRAFRTRTIRLSCAEFVCEVVSILSERERERDGGNSSSELKSTTDAVLQRE
jgi:hypothetical protein